ncbi:MAG: DNA repair protein RecO C-terminal domain-containing protein, partial [Bacteroidota bacterium]
IAVFLAEILYKCIKEQENCSPLFNFIHDSIFSLDAKKDQFEDFHLQFLFKLSDYLGFGMADSISVLNDSTLRLLNAPYQKEHRLSGSDRRDTLKHIVDFYKTHIDGFGEVKSISVLSEVLQ